MLQNIDERHGGAALDVNLGSEADSGKLKQQQFRSLHLRRASGSGPTLEATLTASCSAAVEQFLVRVGELWLRTLGVEGSDA